MSHSDSSQSESENMDTTYVDQCYSTDKCCKMDNKLDRLSALPDHLLLHILSSFQMKDVIRTGFLSKRWRLLWTSAHNLSFTHSPESNRDVTEFIKSIDDTLILSKPSKLNKFLVEFPYIDDQFPYIDDQLVDHVNRWMIFVTIKSVEYAKLSSEVVDAICSGCPGLESLKFCMCFGVLGFHINSKNVKKLVIGGYWYQENENSDDEYKELMICSRNITSLEINGSFHKKLLVLQNVQALVNAKLYSIDFRTNQKMLSDLLASLSNVEKLFIGPWCLQV
ncbi:putative F-box/LRR-repeat protein [Capsicum chinense]|nr:putative F-box/LRR-repeat protein [Capsicum chinense]